MARLRRAGLLAPRSMEAAIAREFQRIKRPILATLTREAAPGRGSQASFNRLMVTSAHPGDGKTFTSMNLALSLAAELDHSVLLVDGDVIKPGISRALGLNDRPGLMELLADEQRVPEDFIVATDIPHLSVLPAGRRDGQSAERLSSRRMEGLAKELSSDPSRIVVFDSSPLLATAESQALALNMGQIVMVVRAGRTERRAVDAALSLIEPSNAEISLVLNQSRKGFGDDYDGYYGVYQTEGNPHA
ncbi:AAA family ATPase [Salinisphaera sp. T31B1]|uniref:AAA family ATPase n=1 Tax=Salinisphaera sp. T31B1 TaxID=727963 RepID=UPI00333F7DFB